jgi:hypothetical protein
MHGAFGEGLGANGRANGGANDRADINKRSSSTREELKSEKNTYNRSLPLRFGVSNFSESLILRTAFVQPGPLFFF